MRRTAVVVAVILAVVVASGAAQAKWKEVRKPIKPTAEILDRGDLDCSGAIPISVGQTVQGTNVGAPSNVDGYPVCISWPETGGEVVYELTVDEPCSDIGISLWYRPDLCDLDWFLLNSCEEDSCVEYDDYGWYVECLDPGTYYIVVDGYQGDECDFLLSVYRNESEAECTPLNSICHMWDFNVSDESFQHAECGIPLYAWDWGARPTGVPATACGGTEVVNVLTTGLSGSYPDEAGDAAWVGPVLLDEGCNCLEICHFYLMEEYYDGGMVGITIDGGATWSLLTPARGYDYIGDWDSSCIGPFPCFTGEDASEFRIDSFDLTPWIGETVSIGFFFGSDGSTQALGWSILWAAMGTSDVPVEHTSWGAIKAMYR
jgi:hypothetical protein